ncbi:AraC family transcriptional regulator, partial [Micromonospora chalcea]
MLAAMTEQTETRKQRAARRAGEFPPAPEPLPVPVPDSHTHLDITVGEFGTPPGGASGDDPVAAAIAAMTPGELAAF